MREPARHVGEAATPGLTRMMIATRAALCVDARLAIAS